MHLKSVHLPSDFSRVDILDAYIFGSTAKGIVGNDIDVALFIRSDHPSFQVVGSEYNLYTNGIEYHVFPDNEYGRSIFQAMLDIKDYKYGTGKGVAVLIEI